MFHPAMPWMTRAVGAACPRMSLIALLACLNSVGVSATGGMVVSAQHMPDVAMVWQVCTCSC
jgi:hypothetical protein